MFSSNIIIDIVLGFWILLFGAMAIFPLFLDRSPAGARRQQNQNHTHQTTEDRVLRLQHRAVLERQQELDGVPSLAARATMKDNRSHRSAA